jgi:hypothetical protein
MRSKFQPYIRRANGKERSEDLRTAIRLAFYQQLRRPFYVMVQRGYPRHVMAVGASRHDIAKSLLGARVGGFKAWSKRVQRRASGA